MTQAYLDTIEALAEDNELLKTEVSSLRLADEIRREKGKQKAKRKGRHFTKQYINALKKELKNLNTSEKALVYSLSLHLEYETNFVVDDDGQRMGISQVASLMGWKKTNTINVINNLVEKGFLEKLKDGQKVHLIMNKNFFFRGTEK